MNYWIKGSLLVFLNLLLILGNAQKNNDSLWGIWKDKKQNDSLRLNALNDLAWNLMFTQPDSTFKIAQIQINYAKKKKILKWESGGYNIQAISCAVRGSNKEAEQLFNKTYELKLKEKDSIGAAATLNNLGLLYEGQGNYPKALDMMFKALKIKEELKDSVGLANGYGNIAIVYDGIKDYKRANDYYQKALQLLKLLGNKRGYAQTYHDMGINIKEQGLIDSALNIFLKAKELFEEIKIENSPLYSSLGVVYLEKEEYEQAELYLKKAIDVAEKNQDAVNLTASYGHLGNLYFIMGKYQPAKELCLKGFQLAEETGSLRQSCDNANYLYKIYKKEGNISKTLEYFEIFVARRDTLYNEEKSKDIARYEVKFDFDKKATADSIDRVRDKEIDQQRIEKQESEIELKRSQQYFLFGGLGLVLVFAFFMFNRFKVTQRQKSVIEKQKEEVEQQKSVIEHQKHEVEEKNKEITDSINYAKRIQEAILPSRYSLVENLKNGFVLYKPKDIVAGDFYWLEKVDDTIYFAAADCTGHGVPGAMVSVVCSNALSKTLLEEGITDPGKILDRTRELVIEKFSKSGNDVKDGMDISLCKIQFTNDNEAKLYWAGANNPLWIIKNLSDEVEEIKPNKQPIGKYAEPTPFTTQQIEIRRGDSFYIFTDGFSDQFGGLGEGIVGSGKKFKAANFKKLLLSIQNEKMDDQKDLINTAFEKWRGELEQVDDVCVIGVRI